MTAPPKGMPHPRQIEELIRGRATDGLFVHGTRTDLEVEFECPVCRKADVFHRWGEPVLVCQSGNGCDPREIIALLENPSTPLEGAPLAFSERSFRRKVEQEKERLLVREQALAEVAEEKAAETASEWFGIGGEDFDPESPEPVTCVLEYAPERYAFAPGIHFLFGPRSAVKTWLAYFAVVQEVTRGNRALVIDYEMSYEEAMRRLYTLGMKREHAQRVVYVHPSGPPSDGARAELLARFGDTPPTVVVIDSMGMGMGLSGLDSNSDTDAARWASEVPLWLKAQWSETVILIIDHVPKGSGAEATDPIGSQRKGAFADGLYNVGVLSKISRRTRGSGRVKVRKDRKGMHEEDQALLDFTFGGGGRFEVSEPDPQVISIELGDAAAELVRIAAYVAEHPGVKVEDARNALDIQSVAFTAHKKSLVSQGVIEHRQRQGLFPGPNLQAYLDASDPA